MIAFKIEAKDSMRIIDQWNSLQNQYRIRAEDMADAISRLGPLARQANVELEQLNGMVASMVGATGLSGLK
jgi:TP901 family phage tail tape measure protein